MSEDVQLGSRGIYVADEEQNLPYRLFDADHHLYAPSDAVTRYLPPGDDREGLASG